MNSKKRILNLAAVIAISIAIAAIVMLLRTEQKEVQKEAPEEQSRAEEPETLKAYEMEIKLSTDKRKVDIEYENGMPKANPALVGKWQNEDNPQYYKVYYDDYDEEHHAFWGKEWDESEDVYEEDLIYHGNGWFRWEAKDNSHLYEYATMDTRDVPIAKRWEMKHAKNGALILTEEDYAKQIPWMKKEKRKQYRNNFIRL